jgi:hypothetical protein
MFPETTHNNVLQFTYFVLLEFFIKNKPVQLANGDILCPSSTEGGGDFDDDIPF